jgi:hypothetical protein
MDRSVRQESKRALYAVSKRKKYHIQHMMDRLEEEVKMAFAAPHDKLFSLARLLYQDSHSPHAAHPNLCTVYLHLIIYVSPSTLLPLRFTIPN